MRRTVFLSLLMIPGSFCALAGAADRLLPFAIRAGKIWTVTDGVISDGVIVVSDGKIEAVGKNPEFPAGAQVVDMSDKEVIPGLIDAHCHIGLSLDVIGEMDETVHAVTPDMRISDAFNPLAEDIKQAVCSGVTTVLLSPGNKNPIGGQTAVVKLNAGQTEAWVLKRSAGIKFSLRDEALMFDRAPTSRAGLVALIRDQLNQARAHTPGQFDPGREVLKRVVDAQMQAYISASTVDEIAAAMTLADEYALNAVLVEAAEGDEIAEMIAERNLPVIYPPLLLYSRDKDLKRVVEMARNGVKLAFGSAAPKTALYDLRTSAMLAVRYGLSAETALESLTINAAEILGVADRVGSIQKGKDADMVFLSGDPLQLTSSIEMVMINGRTVYERQEE